MQNGLTPSERFVASLCERSFLKLWTHPNPKGKKGKELCDCLVVCGPHVVIISVKENKYRATDDATGWERWTKAAIEKSASQIWGAERWLESADKVERHDGRVITLPKRGTMRYHRVAVALGGRGQVPLKWGDFGNGFVHVCDEYSIGALFTVLDTISDFVEFLDASETIVKNGVHLLFDGGGIEDLIALYILNGRSFEIEPAEQEQPSMLVLADDLWRELVESEEFQSMQTDLKQSYAWDRLLEHFADDLLTGGMFDMHSKEVTDNELALVTMALEPRMNRAVLAEALLEFLQKPELKSAARVVQGREGYAYIFTIGKSDDREFRVQELGLRCLVVRGMLPNTHTVVGIATDRPGTSTIGYSSDIVYLHMPEWTAENEQHVRGIQEDLGYFKNVRWSER
jgi:hypothetical protein